MTSLITDKKSLFNLNKLFLLETKKISKILYNNFFVENLNRLLEVV